MAGPRTDITVGRARLAGGRAGDRERLAAALDQVSPAAIGLPPRATLVLGRFVAPRPLALGRTPDAFVRGIQDGLRDRAAAARRAMLGRLGDDCYFEDEDEIELALVRLALSPQGPTPAWVALLPGGGQPMTRWRRLVLTDPVRLPRLVARLASAGLAVDWLERFDAAELEAAAARLFTVHGVDAETPPIATRRDAPAPQPAASRFATPLSRPAAAVRLAATIRQLCPEHATLAMAPAIRRLVLASLVAARRPALLTAPGLAAAIQSLVEAAAASGTPGASETPRVSARSTIVPAAPADRPPTASTSPIRAQTGARLSQPAALALSPGATPSPAATSPSDALPTPDPLAIAEVDTRFGGLFFLLNVFVALGLWSDFTRPRDGLPGLSPFELLGMLGRHWYGSTFAGDPIDAACRSLAGLAPRERPGAHFDAPVWSVPPTWLAPWPQGRPRRHGVNHWHPAGFPLRDGGRQRPSSQRRRRWVLALGRYLDARLAVALGEECPAAARDLVCRRPARIAIEDDRVTVRFSLEDHPLAIRLAGLDRDPGRLAGTAAAVRFEFDA